MEIGHDKTGDRAAGGAFDESDASGFRLGKGDPLAELRAMSHFVIGQLGQSLDGHIATRTGHSKYINDRRGLAHLHALRAAVDAVLVGVGTVNDDDPLLTVRLCEGKSPARIIVDPKGRVFADARIFADGGPETIILTDAGLTHPLGDRVRIIGLPCDNGRLDPALMVAALREAGFNRILVEGGSRTLSAFIDRGCLDRLHLIIAPMLIGGGYQGLHLSAVSTVDAALRPSVTLYHLGHDILCDCTLLTGALAPAR